MTWDALQREMLTALGHTVYVSADAPAKRQDAGLQRVAEVETKAPGPRRPDALLRALLRAADIDEARLALLQLQLPPLEILAGNAGAKRALWPVLRAMRGAEASKASKAAGRDPPYASGISGISST